MSLIKNLNINTKDKIQLLVLIIISSMTFNYFFPSRSLAADTTIKAQVCQDGPKTAAVITTTPNNGASIPTSNINYKIRTDWANFLTVKLNGNTVFNQSVSYQADVETTVPLAHLLASPQVNNITIEITGGCPETTVSHNTQLIFLADLLSYNTQATQNRSPELSGEINNPNLEVRVYIQGRSGFFRAINHRNGKWTLPAGTITPDLEDGNYEVKIESFNTTHNQVIKTKTYTNGLKIDNLAPELTFNGQAEYDHRSPELNGTVSEPDAKIEITINSHTYTAINNGDGTWKLPPNTIKPLANGDYDIIIKVTDPAGNFTDIRTNFKINAKNSLGFLIPPNTGYLRIGRTNIPSWLIYLIIIATTSGILIKRKQTNKS